MKTLGEIAAYLKAYDGPPLRLMEVCGTHTAEITRNGIPAMLSPRIRLISGPGCPVCVTVTAVIDRLVALAETDDTTVLSFGDLLRVPGSTESLAAAKSAGASVDFVYAPAEALDRAAAAPKRRFVFAAVGFETTAPVYAALLEEMEARGIRNVRLLTSLKTMPGAIRHVASHARTPIDGFLAPGHVCAVAGTADYERLAEELRLPFVVSGFRGEELLCAIYALVKLRGQATVRNLYPSVVRAEGNARAKAAVGKYFRTADASWRGLGNIAGSGLLLRDEYASYDAGSALLTEDRAPAGCRCGEVIAGSAAPTECPMYGKGCTPSAPYGACMVSAEGSCYSWYTGNRR